MISLSRKEIEALIDLPRAAAEVEKAYRLSSQGDANLPPVGHIVFPDFEADCHIKYGHLKGDENFVIKVATGFPRNVKAGMLAGNGLMMVLSAETGEVKAVLHDEAMLTDIRTGIGGAIATNALANKDFEKILIVGSGEQARRQIEAHVAQIQKDLSFQVWGRNEERVTNLINSVSNLCQATMAKDLEEAVGNADVIVTATGSTKPIVQSDWVQPGTHITAVGADAPGKQELETELVARADVLVADKIDQCVDHGEVSHAAVAASIDVTSIKELGSVLSGETSGRTEEKQITIADQTGIAAQDIAMANSVLAVWAETNGQ